MSIKSKYLEWREKRYRKSMERQVWMSKKAKKYLWGRILYRAYLDRKFYRNVFLILLGLILLYTDLGEYIFNFIVEYFQIETEWHWG